MDELEKMVKELMDAFDFKGFSLGKNKDGSISTDLQSIILLCILTKSETEELWVEQQIKQYEKVPSAKQKISKEEFIKTTKHYYTEAISMFIAGLISSLELEFPASVDYLLGKHGEKYGIDISRSKKVDKEEYDEYMKDDKPNVDPNKMN